MRQTNFTEHFLSQAREEKGEGNWEGGGREGKGGMERGRGKGEQTSPGSQL